jgi:hypothetical protein
MTTPPTAPPVPPWWPPMLYTFFGACLGFAVTRLTNWLDERRAQKRFFAAVHTELTAINEHLKGTLKDATENKEQFDKGRPSALYLATTFQRGIFDSQIGKLKSVAEPLVIEIVQFYDKLSNLERVKSLFTSVGFELTGLKDTDERVAQLSPKYYSALSEIIKRSHDLLPLLSSLIAKLQQIG